MIGNNTYNKNKNRTLRIQIIIIVSKWRDYSIELTKIYDGTAVFRNVEISMILLLTNGKIVAILLHVSNDKNHF